MATSGPSDPADEAAEGGGRGGSRGPGGGGRGGFGGQDYSSPVIADGKLYFTARFGDMYVFGLGDELEQLAVKRVTTEREDFGSSPESVGRLGA
jgi:hypothetical protein